MTSGSGCLEIMGGVALACGTQLAQAGVYARINDTNMYDNSEWQRMITPEEVEHIGWLARIKLSEEEKKQYAGQMNDILDYFGKIDEIDTNVEPTYHVLALHNVFREDADSESMKQEDVLANAPKEKDGYFKTPRIV